MSTRVVHCRKDDFDIYIGRSMPRYPELKATGWGNPFKPAPDVDAIAQYREWVLQQSRLVARLPELHGKVLGCWCAPKGGMDGDLYGHVCHGEVLAALADMSKAALDELVTATHCEPKRPTIKVISLWQPWATLMAAGYKRIETRSWPPRGLKSGQLVAIHAAKRWTEDERDICIDDPYFRRYLTLAQRRGLWDFERPPLGCVVAVARYQEAISTDAINTVNLPGAYQPQLVISYREDAFGNYGPDRYGWVFSEVRPLEPIPLRGMQGIFDWTPPAELHYLEPRNAAKAVQHG